MSEQTHERVEFNLDSLEREQTYRPFTVNVNDRVITMNDPAELDWRQLLEIEQPAMFLRHCISQDDRDYLREQKIPGWKFGKMIEAYQRHYGLDTLGNAGGSPI